MGLTELKKASRLFPLAPRRTALLQACRLIKAREYLKQRGIEAVSLGSKFQYARSTGSVLA